MPQESSGFRKWVSKWLLRRKAQARAELGLDLNQRFAEDSIQEFGDGELVFREGDTSREMFVVVHGEIEVLKQTPRGELVLARLGQGDFVGEMSLLESLPRSATARARGSTRLLAIHPGGFLIKIRRDPTFAFEVMQTLSRRIRTTNESLMRELAESNKAESSQRIDSIKAIIQGAEYQPQPEPQTSPGFDPGGAN